MSNELKKDFAWSLLVPTSMGVRISPVAGQQVHCSDTFKMQATSAETNVASIAASLGLPVKVLTIFVRDSPVARFIKTSLASRNMSYEGREVDQEGPWGGWPYPQREGFRQPIFWLAMKKIFSFVWALMARRKEGKASRCNWRVLKV